MLFGTLRYIFVKFLCLFNNIHVQSMRGIIIIIMGVKEQGGEHSAMEATQSYSTNLINFGINCHQKK